MKYIDYAIVLKEEVNNNEMKIINLYWEVYFDFKSNGFRFCRDIDEIFINLDIGGKFPLEEMVRKKSYLIIFDTNFSCISCKKPLKINSRDLEFWKNKDKTCDSCSEINTYMVAKDLIDKVEIYNNKIKKRLSVVVKNLNYLEKIYVLAIYDNILLDEFGKLDSSDCQKFWIDNHCQNNPYFKDLFDNEILIEIDEDLFNYLRLNYEINSVDLKGLDNSVVNYLSYFWSKRHKFGIYLNYPIEFYSHDVWVESIRLELQINNLNNSDVECLIDFYTYIRYRECLMIINEFLLKENLEINRGNDFNDALMSFMKNSSLFDLIYFIECELKFEVSKFKNKKIKSNFVKFDFSVFILKYKGKKCNFLSKRDLNISKCYFVKYFEQKFIKKTNDWFDCSLCDIIELIKNESEI